jgi:hypothetical protein
MKEEHFWFTHDSNSKDDPKCVLLIEQLGLEGYGCFWVLVETLRDQVQYKYPLALIPALARRFNITIEKMRAVILNYGLFKITSDEFFFSDSLIERMKVLENKREFARLAGIKSADLKRITTDVERSLKGGSTNIEYNRIIYNKKEFYDEVAKFLDTYPKEMLRKFFDYWTELNKSQTKMRFEMEKTWELSKRLRTWASIDKDFNKKQLPENEFIPVKYLDKL